MIGEELLNKIFKVSKRPVNNYRSDKVRHLQHTSPPSKARRPCKLCQKQYKEIGWL